MPGGGGSGSSGVTTQDEGVTVGTAQTTLNFTGSGVTASSVGATTTINIPSGGGGGGSIDDALAITACLA